MGKTIKVEKTQSVGQTTSFKTPKDIFKLTRKQELEIKRIKDWEELSELKNITIGNKIDIYA